MDFQNDPFWQRISASLQGRKLYIKMPYSAVPGIRQDMYNALSFYRSEQADAAYKYFSQILGERVTKGGQQGHSALIFSLSRSDVRSELEKLKAFQNPAGRLLEYIQALQGGLRRDPKLDWIKRVRDPNPTPSGEPPPSSQTDPDWDFY